MKKFLLKFNISYFFYKIIKIFRNSKKNVHLGEFGEDIFEELVKGSYKCNICENKIPVKSNVYKLKNVKTSCCRAESVKDKYDFVISRAVTNMKDFVSWIKYNINKKSFNDLKNGVLYLKGGDLKEELKSFKNVKTFELSDFFNEDFFNEKKVVYLPIKYKTKN